MLLTITANPAIDRVYFVDKFEMGEVHRPIRMTYTAGGKGINVARVASILGTDTAAMGFAGGNNGAFIRSEVKKLGIKEQFTEIDGETRICINISDSAGRSGEILESGPVLTKAEADRFLKTYEDNIESYELITISGSLPQGLDDDFYPQLIHTAALHNKKIIVDTGGKAFIKVLEAKPYMVKPNRFELSQYLGYEVQELSAVKDALKLLYDKGIAVPLCSLGKDGAAAYIDGHFYRYITPDIEVKNTVGSGDSTIAGIATGLHRGYTPENAIRLGMAAGTANTQFSETGMVSTELVEKYYNEIIMEEF